MSAPTTCSSFRAGEATERTPADSTAASARPRGSHDRSDGVATLGVASAADPAQAAARVNDTDPASIVLVGNPNVGKSSLFGALTGAYVMVSNYPGTTVEVTRGFLNLGGKRTTVIDTPGTASFIPSSEDERVTRDILMSGRPRAVVAVGDAKNLERVLLLALQIDEMGLPGVLCLNMMDEATERGIGVDTQALAARLGMDVIPTVAVRHQGIARLVTSIESARTGVQRVAYPEPIEQALEDVLPHLPQAPISPRALGLMVLSGDETLTAWLRGHAPEGALVAIENVHQRLRRRVGRPVAYVVGEARRRAVAKLASGISSRNHLAPLARKAVARRLEMLSTHPVWGIPILAGVLALTYLFVGVLGAQVLVDLLERRLFEGLVNPAVIWVVERTIPWALLRELLVGPYGFVTMAITYSLALVLPIVGTFFIAFGLLEDSGYLPRLAVMANRLFKQMGLNGKAILPMVLGLGCDTMATLTTRVLETPKERLVVILLLALGVPCSAQLAVILAMLSPLSATAFLIWLGVVIAVILGVGKLAALVLPGRGSDFVLELPPLRVPQLGNILVKTGARIEWYLREAVPLFVLGTLVLFAADRLQLLGAIERLAKPVLSGALGLPEATAPAFIVGFLRRDFGAAGLYQMARDGGMDPIQVVVAAVTITLFLPCIANLFVIVKERGWRTALAITAFVLPFALAVGATLNALLRALPFTLQ